MPVIDQSPGRHDDERLDGKAERGAERQLGPAPFRPRLERDQDAAEDEEERGETECLADGEQPDPQSLVPVHRPQSP